MSGRVDAVRVSNGGVPKRAVPSACIRKLGVEGDRQADRRYHGGPDRAVSLFSAEVIAAIRAEGHPIEPGSTGENLTISGLDWTRLVPPMRLRVGRDAILEITEHVKPCKTIAASFLDGRFERIAPRRHPVECRLYARVLREGEVREGDPVEVLPPRPRWRRAATKIAQRIRRD
ncbi:MAG TPA: MOSC domain-containing protein [Planctomycetota bacterium]|nr:MOSC domain-containing protein [Planctomycetota bacterium]